MPELTEDKTRRLLLIVEVLAIGTAAVLILIDYKLKQDLVALFRQIEAAMNYESRLYSANAGNPDSYSVVFDSSLVGDNPPVEKTAPDNADKPHAAEPKPTGERKSAVRGSGARSKKVPDADKSVGS